ncbi:MULTISPECIES: 5-formyltetrahydrofolate cyclo-ligase [unclassified Bartonella]|uniref:5-formyltetrahydrofolate cyclo-ligase n=1 Tax=unclassified Bartonella TaxID=2645622 RepID=UPI00099A3A59|nr:MULTISPECIES: 5-formyltetrahydrofolate cyclo-ligase [unclassified Bartonella]AQX28423.1 5-formyltetrahydrofolate cyclo-ligase [Bartonella sp. JB15]AQX29690.1 5-formyltetrahydrofolate cyclo-ligase [Bartonella sp. JB63]
MMVSSPSLFLSIRNSLRQFGLSQRNCLSLEERNIFSQQACLHISEYLAQRVHNFSQIIFAGYWPIRSELDPRPLFDFISSRGGNLALPVVLDHKMMVFRHFSDEKQLEPMHFGIFCPNSEQSVVFPDFIFVPLSAFDRQGHRLGYGAGYYDRVIAHLRNQAHPVHLFGFGFSCQEVLSIPAREDDLLLEGIFTEKGFLEP